MIYNKSKTFFLTIAKANYELQQEKKQKKQLLLQEIKKEIFIIDQIISTLKNTNHPKYLKHKDRVEKLKKIIKKFSS